MQIEVSNEKLVTLPSPISEPQHASLPLLVLKVGSVPRTPNISVGYPLRFILNLTRSLGARQRLCVGMGVRAWLLTYLVIHFLCLPSNVLFIALCIRLGFFHLLVLRLSHCICSQPLDPIRIHLLCYTHGDKRMASHDVVQNVFTTITRDVGFHVSQEQIHILPPLTLQFLHHLVDIVFLVNAVCTLADVVITNSI